MIDIFFQPKTFNYIIMVMYTLNAFWWLYHGKWSHCFYWIGALILTIALTTMVDKNG